MKFAIIDVETTGMSSMGNRITEIAIVIHDGEKVLDRFHTLVDPQTAISPYVVRLTGIDNDMVNGAPLFEDIAAEIQSLTKECIFVAHNVNFDYNVIRSEFQRIQIDYTRKKLCTVRLSRKIFPGFRSYSLGRLCSTLEIPLNDRHRAMGDTNATVLLFEKLLEADSKGEIKKQLNPRTGESSLPSLLPKSVFDGIPDAHGVYYFKDANGKIIYVGKAKSLRKRVLGHFYDKTAREVAMCRDTADIDFELSGSELIALLMESEAIKHHYPKYNRAQKHTNKGFGILYYKNRNGILQMGFNPLKLVSQPLYVCYNQTECIAFLENLCETYNLCPKFMQLQPSGNVCNHYKLNSCQGICRDEEDIDAYNERVRQAINSVRDEVESYILIEKGRKEGEEAFVMVEDGVYLGYGFLPDEIQINHFEEFKDFLERRYNNSDIYRILRQYINAHERIRMVSPAAFKTMNN
ncbi:exonuclease domain-containing protein [Robertkochia solimangrovi]|uniref:exonuclease domain-containing protein n=1 Tax=Robertkochia solimangrovi TaxID=2213046 RepID=UPI001181135D|nr:exonuclease domain-containing protein [Robertkochia solimangrovi]TRZ46411.1 DNA polymerase III subunit epsilon [Robertkochia solimangrovi]